MTTRRVAFVAAAILLAVAIVPASVLAQGTTTPPDVSVNVEGVGNVSAPLQIVIVLTLLTFLPAALVIMTSFTRIVIVFHFLRQALGTQEMPSNQILIGLTLFLTAFIMAPVADRIHTAAVAPVIAGEMSMGDAMTAGAPPLREFMLRQTREADLALFVELSRSPRPTSPADLPMRVVIPAFAISELKTGFQMGFFLFVPVSGHRPRGLHDASLDGHAAVAAGDDFAAVQGAAVRDGGWVEPVGLVSREEFSVMSYRGVRRHV